MLNNAQQTRRNSQAVFDQYADRTWYDLYRRIHKNTACGPTIGIWFKGETEIKFNNELQSYTRSRVAEIIEVSSVVEGVAQATSTERVLLNRIRGIKQARAAMAAAVKRVDQEACEIWNATHGCSSCARSLKFTHPETGAHILGGDGLTPVNPNCKKCKGYGAII